MADETQFTTEDPATIAARVAAITAEQAARLAEQEAEMSESINALREACDQYVRDIEESREPIEDFGEKSREADAEMRSVRAPECVNPPDPEEPEPYRWSFEDASESDSEETPSQVDPEDTVASVLLEFVGAGMI